MLLLRQVRNSMRNEGDPNGPFGECYPRPEGLPKVAAVVHLGSLKDET